MRSFNRQGYQTGKCGRIMLFDTHAHFDDAAFDGDRDFVISSMKEKGVKFVVNIGTDYETSKKSAELAEKYDFIYATAGIYPEYIEKLDIEKLRKLAGHKKVVAIGEIGLDYHYDSMPSREKQIEGFIKQIRLAKELDLPVCVHSRDAVKDTVDVLFKEDPKKVIIHCCSAKAETVKQYVSKGYYISFAGPVSFKNAKSVKEAAKCVPDNLLLIETDSPYMCPEPFRGQRCDPSKVLYVAKALAELRGQSLEEIERITLENGRKIYGI